MVAACGIACRGWCDVVCSLRFVCYVMYAVLCVVCSVMCVVWCLVFATYCVLFAVACVD